MKQRHRGPRPPMLQPFPGPPWKMERAGRRGGLHTPSRHLHFPLRQRMTGSGEGLGGSPGPQHPSLGAMRKGEVVGWAGLPAGARGVAGQCPVQGRLLQGKFRLRSCWGPSTALRPAPSAWRAGEDIGGDPSAWSPGGSSEDGAWEASQPGPCTPGDPQFWPLCPPFSDSALDRLTLCPWPCQPLAWPPCGAPCRPGVRPTPLVGLCGHQPWPLSHPKSSCLPWGQDLASFCAGSAGGGRPPGEVTGPQSGGRAGRPLCPLGLDHVCCRPLGTQAAPPH